MSKGKRLIAAVSAFLLMVPCCTFSAVAEEVEPKLLFDMDLTDFDPSASSLSRGVVDTTGTRGTEIELRDVPTHGEFLKGPYEGDGETIDVPYVELITVGKEYNNATTGSTARIWIDNEDWHGKSYTAEVWMKATQKNYGGLIRVYDGMSTSRTNAMSDTAKDEHYSAGLGFFNNQNFWFGTHDFNSKSVPEGVGQWVHVTITRSVEEIDGEMVAEHAAYMNGKLVFSANTEITKNGVTRKVSRTTIPDSGRAGMGLGVFSNASTYASPSIKFADAKIYEGILSADTIAEHFVAEREIFGMEAPNSVISGESNVAADAESINITLNSAIADEELQQVVLRNKADKSAVNAEIKADGTALTIVPNEYLKYGEEYIVDFSPFYCKDYEISVSDTPVALDAKPFLSGNSVSFNLKSDGEEHSIKVLVTGYNAEGKICGAVSKKYDMTGADVSDTLTVDGLESWYNIKFMVWENEDGFTRPLIDDVIIK